MHTDDFRQREVMFTNLNLFIDDIQQFMARTFDQTQEMIDTLRTVPNNCATKSDRPLPVGYA